MTRARDGILVSWVSVGQHAEPFIEALANPRSLLADRIGRIVLLYRQGPKDDPGTAREREALQATVRDLRRKLEPVSPEIVRKPWKTDASPIDHAALRPFVEKVLTEVRETSPGAPIYVHVSPGTPAMHAIWLVLVATGFVSEPIHLVQGVRARDRAEDDPPVIRVEFPLDTWLRRFRSLHPSRTSDEDDGLLWDPTQTRSEGLRQVLASLERWAPLRVPVLLIGERGTGKTTLAGQLRARSPFQREGLEGWPVVVCGQFRVNPQLARSELFGHKKGAFTGATSDRKGLLETADGDTIFLDEIGDIDRDTQRLLMAALDGRGFSRLGDSEVLQSRFRLVCATNRTLEQLRDELLDADFFDRIAVAIVRVPPLRECRDDLPGLWRSVLRRAVQVAEVAPPGWETLYDNEAILGALATHALPGNLRDLQRASYHALAALQAERTVDDAVKDAVGALDGLPEVHAEPTPSFQLPLEGGLEAEMRRHRDAWIRAALDAADGNKSAAAKLLEVNRRTFSDWADELD